MISDRSLALAVERGILAPDQVERLREIERASEQPSGADGAPAAEEQLRFIGGFGDIFVSIGLLLFLGSVAYFAFLVAGPIGCGGVVAAVSWALAEFFARRRRMALPSIVLVQSFAAAIFGAGLFAGSRLSGLNAGGQFQLDWLQVTRGNPTLVAIAALMTAAAIAVHYVRFRVPIGVADGMAALLLVFMAALVRLAPDFTFAWYRVLLFGYGLLIFALAMRFDRADPQRLTRKTDIAFWLHFLAAPLIVHSSIGAVVGNTQVFDVGTAFAILGTFLLLGLVAVMIDRRAFLVVGLAYAGAACASLLRKTGFGGITVPATLLLLGAFILLLSAGWQRLRLFLLGLLPGTHSRTTPRSGSHSTR